MANDSSPAAKFIEDAVTHPDWLRTVESGDAAAVVKLAAEQGYPCTLEELKAAAKAMIATTGERGEPSKDEVDAAAGGMTDLSTDVGYGDDTGYAALFGVAGLIARM